jgi:hypothetical protein
MRDKATKMSICMMQCAEAQKELGWSTKVFEKRMREHVSHGRRMAKKEEGKAERKQAQATNGIGARSGTKRPLQEEDVFVPLDTPLAINAKHARFRNGDMVS